MTLRGKARAGTGGHVDVPVRGAKGLGGRLSGERHRSRRRGRLQHLAGVRPRSGCPGRRHGRRGDPAQRQGLDELRGIDLQREITDRPAESI